MTRERNVALLHEYVKNEGLRNHMLAVEAAMTAYARRLGEDEALWATVGLLHDFDWEAFPDAAEHTVKGGEILAGRGYPPEVIRAIHTHNPANNLGLEPETTLEKALYACDELCGFITAVALVRPSKSLDDLTAKSVVKKFKDKAFARQVSREDIKHGTEIFGVDLNEHVDFVIQAMKTIATELGLDGSLARANS